MSPRLVDHGVLAVTGYTDRLSARPGERVSVHASSIHTKGSWRLVRLDHDGKSFTKEPIGSSHVIELARREVRLGSYGLVDSVKLPAAPVVLRSWVWLTLLPAAESKHATLLSIGGLALTVDAAGKVTFSAGEHSVKSTAALQVRRWYEVTGGLDANRRPFVTVRPQRPLFGEIAPDRTVSGAAVEWTPRSDALVLGRGFNGKLEDVSISRGEVAEAEEILRLDFARGISGWCLHDHHGTPVGRAVGLPTRAVKGRRWNGTQNDWRHAPEHYAAIHFHADDQCDQQWPVTATVELPEDLPVGLYAVELSAGNDIDHLPLVVRRGRGSPAPMLVVLPTLSYVAYAFEHVDDHLLTRMGWDMRCPEELAARFARANGYHSLYDVHADGSRVTLCSIRRPLLGLRPDHRPRFIGCEHQLSADLHLLGWLKRQGFAFDIATDHDLDAAGVDLLKPYRAVLTGHHPEYMTTRVLDAIDGYLDSGGNLAYLGGNGFYVTIALDPGDASVIELRRGEILRQWEGDAGDDHFQFTGNPSGGWSGRGRFTAALVGVTWVSTGMADGVPFRRTAASHDPRVAHLFDGIGADELIGEHGAFLGAAASIEVDVAHPLLGTPAHALVVATAQMPDKYMSFPRALLEASGGEDPASQRRADMTWFETAAGGAVFSASSMGWSGALSHDSDRNAVSRLTANLLKSFIARRG